MTDKYAVIGNPVAHSQSPFIHQYFARQTGQDLSYEKLLAPLDGFPETVRAFIAAGGRGMNVTVPFKKAACALATRLATRAAVAGAANTLAFDGGAVVGDNTDGAGLVRDMRDNLGCAIGGQRVLLLGAGGAARGVLLPLLEECPAELVIANRTASTARALAGECGRAARDARRTPHCALQGIGLGELAGRRFDIVINATSAGLDDAAPDIPPGIFVKDGLAYEMVYARQTPFMRQAADAGARVSDGLGMLVEQAAESFLLWRGIRPETVPVLRELRAS